MNVNWIEAIWLLICLTGIVSTLFLLADSLGERELVQTLKNGRFKIRNLTVASNIRREAIRLIMQIFLATAVLPGLIRPGDVNLVFDFNALARAVTSGVFDDRALATMTTIAIVCLMATPIGMLTSSLFDRRDRQRLRDFAIDVVREERLVSEEMVLKALTAERASVDAETMRGYERLLKAIEAVGGQIVDVGSKADVAGDKADAAYHEANSVNIKIAKLDKRLLKQGQLAAAEIKRTDIHQEVQDGRIEVVEDNHPATKRKKPAADGK